MEGARFLALLLYFEGRGAIAPLKREALKSYFSSPRYLTDFRGLTLEHKYEQFL